MILALSVLAAPGLSLAGDEAQRLATMSDTELDAGMKAGVQVVLQRVPIQMDDQSTLVGAEYEPRSRIATYHYIQPAGTDPKVLRSRVTTKNCSAPNVRAMLSRGITFRHLFTTGDKSLDFSVTSGDCARLT